MGRWTVVAAVACAGGSGCSHTAQLERVRELDGVRTPATPPGWEGATVSVRPFEDLRPEQAWSTGYARVRYEHPEHVSAFSDEDITRVGDLEQEYPALLARALPPGARVSLGSAESVASVASVEQDPQGPSDFVVRGRLLQSTLSYRAHPLLAVPGLVGVPVARSKIHFRVAVELYEGNQPTPVWSQTYAFDDRRFEGVYYGSQSLQKLAKAALRDSVARAAADVSTAIATRRAGTAAG